MIWFSEWDLKRERRRLTMALRAVTICRFVQAMLKEYRLNNEKIERSETEAKIGKTLKNRK